MCPVDERDLKFSSVKFVGDHDAMTVSLQGSLSLGDEQPVIRLQLEWTTSQLHMLRPFTERYLEGHDETLSGPLGHHRLQDFRHLVHLNVETSLP